MVAAIGAASKLGVPVRLYHAMHRISDDPSWDLCRKSMHRAAERILERGLRRVPSELVATSRVLKGDVAEVIADASAADDIGLLYVGSRGYGPLREAMVGGVVGGLLHGARCPLVIVPEGVEG